MSMETIKTAVSSKTVWTIVALFVVAGTHGIEGLIPQTWVPIVEACIAILSAYFHIDHVNELKGQVRSLGGVAN